MTADQHANPLHTVSDLAISHIFLPKNGIYHLQSLQKCRLSI